MLANPLCTPLAQVDLPRVKTVVYWGEPSGLALQALQVGDSAAGGRTGQSVWLRFSFGRLFKLCVQLALAQASSPCAQLRPMEVPTTCASPLQTLQGLGSLNGVFSFQDCAALGREHPAAPGKLLPPRDGTAPPLPPRRRRRRRRRMLFSHEITHLTYYVAAVHCTCGTCWLTPPCIAIHFHLHRSTAQGRGHLHHHVHQRHNRHTQGRRWLWVLGSLEVACLRCAACMAACMAASDRTVASEQISALTAAMPHAPCTLCRVPGGCAAHPPRRGVQHASLLPTRVSRCPPRRHLTSCFLSQGVLLTHRTVASEVQSLCDSMA